MISKDSIISNKKSAIKSINQLLEHCINSNNPDLLKKADLLSYWIKTYCNYISFEDNFDPYRLLNYSRGDIIKANFGFRIGNELGGLHFAVVLNNNNSQGSTVLTVVPLSSTDGKTIHPNSVDLGTELYERAKAKKDSLHKKLDSEIIEANKVLNTLNQTLELILKSKPPANDSAKPKISSELEARMHEIKSKADMLKTELDCLTSYEKELTKMKSGSMAITNQITTISKQRIYIPKKSTDYLYGLTLSTTAMEKINNKILELYCR